MESGNEEEKKNIKTEGTYSTYNGEVEVQYLLPPKLKRDKTDMFNVAQAKQRESLVLLSVVSLNLYYARPEAESPRKRV